MEIIAEMSVFSLCIFRKLPKLDKRKCCFTPKPSCAIIHGIRPLQLPSVTSATTLQHCITCTLISQVQMENSMKKISKSSCSKIRKKYFSEYQIKRRGDGFACCGRCDHLTQLCNGHPLRSAAYDLVQRMLQCLVREQEAAQTTYSFSKALSSHRPKQVLSIMHDKMDHSKTAFPCIAHRSKTLDSFAKLPVSVTGILAHSHGNRKYAHYTLDLYLIDSNQTIGSIATLLRDLEKPPKSSNPAALFAGAGKTNLYHAALFGSKECVKSLIQKPSDITGFQKLPPVLQV